MTGTFWSTVVICLLTALSWFRRCSTIPTFRLRSSRSLASTPARCFASAAFAKDPFIGSAMLVLGMVSFSYSTILGWSYYGNRCVTYLFGSKAVIPYQVVYRCRGVSRRHRRRRYVWTISDIGNALMAVPNIIAILLLSGMIARETKALRLRGQTRRGIRRAHSVVEEQVTPFQRPKGVTLHFAPRTRRAGASRRDSRVCSMRKGARCSLPAP